MRRLALLAPLVVVAACFPDRTLHKACDARSPCVVDGDRCIDGTCIRGPFADDDDVTPDAGQDDAGQDDAGQDDAGQDDAGQDDAGALG